MFLKKNRIISYAIVLLSIIISVGASFTTFYFLNKLFNADTNTYYILMVFISLLVGTVITWLFCLVLKNPAITYPTNIVYMIALVINFAWRFAGFKDYSVLIIVLIALWGLEGFCKWAFSFNNLYDVDERYLYIKNKYRKTYVLVSLLAFNILPMIVNFCLLIIPLAYMKPSNEFNLSAIFAILLAVSSLIVKALADFQLLKNKKNGLVKSGLWSRSRHPNYLAELVFWVAIYLITIAIRPEMWGIFLGPMLNCLLYGFIKIPLSEKSLVKTYADYGDYKKSTNVLLIFPKKGN